LTGTELFTELRYELKDQNKIRFSDYQLKYALNTTIRIISNALANLHSPMLATAATIAMTSGIGTLPTDYQSIISVVINPGLYTEIDLKPVTLKTTPTNEQYKIMNNSIYSNNSSVDIIYRTRLNAITDTSAELPLNDDFVELIKKYMKAILLDNASTTDLSFTNSISADVAALVTGREYTYIERELPFMI